MRYGLYSIYDRKAKFYTDPRKAENDEVAIRDVKALFDDPKAQGSSYVINAEDYSLAKIGYFDNSNAEIYAEIEPIIDLITLKTGDNENV